VKLVVNGDEIAYGGDSSLTAFLQAQGVESARVAVMVNDAIVLQREREAKTLCEGDRVEIFVFAGGG
jgi:thiamine biosynthesis protein ThiS